MARKNQWDEARMVDAFKRLVFETDGMEFMDWSILAVVVAACVLLWSMRKHGIAIVGFGTVLGDIGTCLENSTSCL